MSPPWRLFFELEVLRRRRPPFVRRVRRGDPPPPVWPALDESWLADCGRVLLLILFRIEADEPMWVDRPVTSRVPCG